MTQRHKHADVIIAWANGVEVEYQSHIDGAWVVTSEPKWLENYEYRAKPPAKKYRVGLFKHPGVEALVSVANSEKEAERYEKNRYFVRWFTDWIEYEVL